MHVTKNGLARNNQNCSHKWKIKDLEDKIEVIMHIIDKQVGLYKNLDSSKEIWDLKKCHDY